MDIEEAIKTRRSIRKYKKNQVKISEIIEVLKLAIWAPSAHNAMPYYFIIVEDSDVKFELIRKMTEEYEKDLKKDKVPEINRKKIMDESLNKFTSPPYLIIPCISMERMHKYRDEKRQKAEYIMAIQSVSAAIQNLLLASHAYGLGCCWYCAPLFCQNIIRRVLKVPSTCDPQAIITIGYPNDNPIPPPRIQLEKITFKNKWGQTF